MLSPEMLEIVGPAFAVGLIIAVTHAPLGIEVLERGIIFIDLAVAQINPVGIEQHAHRDGGDTGGVVGDQERPLIAAVDGLRSADLP